MTPSLQTLFLPFESGAVPVPSGPVLFLGAAWHPALAKFGSIDLWQPFYPLAEMFEHHRMQAKLVTMPQKTYALVLCQIPKQVEEARYMLALAVDCLSPGGWLVAAAANDANGNRLIKWLGALGLDTASDTKNKARAVWAQKGVHDENMMAQWVLNGSLQTVDLGDGNQFKSQPGLFSWDRVDNGSKLLAQHIPIDLTGTGADFGAGIGYLSHQCLRQNPGLECWHLCEADARSLDCLRANLQDVQSGRNLCYHWCDLTKSVPDLPLLDIVVMNPPFHCGKKTDAAIGQAFVSTAASHLKTGGKLYMVANAHLPYEATLAAHFADHRRITQNQGYKILQATK